jgi:hypothetical protein
MLERHGFSDHYPENSPMLGKIGEKEMKIKLTIHPDACYADSAGEALMNYLNHTNANRWGYTTREFTCPVWREESVDIDSELIEATFCCGCFAKEEHDKITKYRIGDGNLIVYLHWDGDGTILFKHLKEGWMLYNSDVKCSRGWKWVEKDNWVYNLPENYYE